MRTPIFLVLLILLSACGSKNQTETTPANSLQDKVISTWEGLIPCADCPGILYNLELKNDSSYNSQMVYQEKPVDPVINSGRWSIDADGKIKLISSGKESTSQYLLFDGEFIEMLDGDGKKMETNLNYKLHKKDPGKNSPILVDNTKNEVFFKATGKEPYWLLELDNNKNIHFKQMDSLDLIMPVEKQEETKDTSVTNYHSTTEQGLITVQLTKKSCIDSLSGIQNAYTVNIKVKKNDEKVFKEFKGCGNYLENIRSTSTEVSK